MISVLAKNLTYGTVQCVSAKINCSPKEFLLWTWGNLFLSCFWVFFFGRFLGFPGLRLTLGLVARGMGIA